MASKICSSFAVSILFCTSNNFTFKPSSISVVHNILEQAPPIFEQQWCELISNEIEHACWEGPTSWYQYDSSVPGEVSDFNALVTLVAANIIQSATLRMRGS
jgi:hypothetical protein